MRPLPHIWNESSKLKREREPETKPDIKDESAQDYKAVKPYYEMAERGEYKVAKRGEYNLKDESIMDYKPGRAYELVADKIDEWFTEEVHHVGEIPGSHNTTFTLPHGDGKFELKLFQPKCKANIELSCNVSLRKGSTADVAERCHHSFLKLSEFLNFLKT